MLVMEDIVRGIDRGYSCRRVFIVLYFEQLNYAKYSFLRDMDGTCYLERVSSAVCCKECVRMR